MAASFPLRDKGERRRFDTRASPNPTMNPQRAIGPEPKAPAVRTAMGGPVACRHVGRSLCCHHTEHADHPHGSGGAPRLRGLRHCRLAGSARGWCPLEGRSPSGQDGGHRWRRHCCSAPRRLDDLASAAAELTGRARPRRAAAAQPSASEDLTVRRWERSKGPGRCIRLGDAREVSSWSG